MLEEENDRVKGLLVATISLYIFGFIVGLFLNRAMNSDAYIIWSIEYSWVLWVTWILLFLGYCWIPVSIFLFIQGIALRKKYTNESFTGDRTVGNLGIVIPVIFLMIYAVTRLIYKA